MLSGEGDGERKINLGHFLSSGVDDQGNLQLDRGLHPALHPWVFLNGRRHHMLAVVAIH